MSKGSWVLYSRHLILGDDFRENARDLWRFESKEMANLVHGDPDGTDQVGERILTDLQEELLVLISY